MTGPRGGFTAYGTGGYRARCAACGWLGKPRGLRLRVVEQDWIAHAVTCGNAGRKAGKPHTSSGRVGAGTDTACDGAGPLTQPLLIKRRDHARG